MDAHSINTKRKTFLLIVPACSVSAVVSAFTGYVGWGIPLPVKEFKAPNGGESTKKE